MGGQGGAGGGGGRVRALSTAGRVPYGPPVRPKKPAAQVQFASDELPAGPWKLGGQGMQLSVVEKRPGPHRGIHVELEFAPVVLLEDNTKVLNVVESL